MMIVVVALAASALIGLTLGLIFRVWINLLAAPVVAIGATLALASQGFGFLNGIYITFVCLLASQIAYVIGTFLAPSNELASYLADDLVDAQPGESGKQDKQQEKRAKDPSWPPPPAARCA